MDFKELTIDLAWIRANGKCECESNECEHKGRCGLTLYGKNRGKDFVMGWKAHHKINPDDDSVKNCILLCNACYKKVAQ